MQGLSDKLLAGPAFPENEYGLPARGKTDAHGLQLAHGNALADNPLKGMQFLRLIARFPFIVISLFLQILDKLHQLRHVFSIVSGGDNLGEYTL